MIGYDCIWLIQHDVKSDHRYDCYDVMMQFFFFIGGYYMYLEANYRRYGDTAVLQSKQFPASKNARHMVFYYYMYGLAVNQLRVLKLVNSTRTQILQLHGNQGPRWIQASVDVSGDQPYKVSGFLFKWHRRRILPPRAFINFVLGFTLCC